MPIQKNKKTVVWILSVLLILSAALYMYFRFVPFKELDTFINRRQYSSRFYDCRGNLVHILALEQGLRREWIDLEQIPQHVRKAFISAEDKNFYIHPGVDICAVIRSAYLNAKHKSSVSGASTITMQLSRIIMPRKGVRGRMSDKIREAAAAFKIECRLSKDEILELYLNNVPFGYQTEGIASAARNFLDLPVRLLSAEQAAVLARIPRRPSAYTGPTRAASYPDDVYHFILFVKDEYKKNNQIIPSDVYLSIDSALTAAAAEEMHHQTLLYDDLRVSDGACLVIENSTGKIRAWAASADISGESPHGEIDGIRALNQFGSALKPFLYALSLERGFSPASVLPDIPMDFGTASVYVPQNFNNRYNGPVLMRRSLASSLNIPAVYLLYRIGVDDYFSVLEKLGFYSLEGKRDSTGLSLALGSCDISLAEMVNAFSVFARGGTVTKLSFLENDERHHSAPTAVYSSETAALICSMLSDRTSRATGFGNVRVFDTPYPSIFKTGTSNQFQDIAAFGSTPEYTAGCWFGNHDGATVKKATGSTIPAHVVRAVLDILDQKRERSSFPVPNDYILTDVCALSGMSEGPSCPSSFKEYVLKGTNAQVCTWHTSDDDGRIQTQYPESYRFWMDNIAAVGFSSPVGQLLFEYPSDGAVFIYDPTLSDEVQKLRVTVSGGDSETAELLVNGRSAGKTNRPFLWNIPIKPGSYILEATCGKMKKHASVYVR